LRDRLIHRRGDDLQLHPLLFGQLAVDSTLAALCEQDALRGQTFRPCPGCTVMTERDQGCNMIGCTTCHREWCFLCGMLSGNGCTHFFCARVHQQDTSNSRT